MIELGSSSHPFSTDAIRRQSATVSSNRGSINARFQRSLGKVASDSSPMISSLYPSTARRTAGEGCLMVRSTTSAARPATPASSSHISSISPGTRRGASAIHSTTSPTRPGCNAFRPIASAARRSPLVGMLFSAAIVLRRGRGSQ
ncbi:hypothetical protein DYQ86_19545 [Acidobacteria bacterium AB60]|nr:hypothetical protein DYQ86_19545 [Acidobacteria bacterium AB60]